MNDRFKFRFWDKKEKEYFTCGKIDHKSGITKTYPYRTYEWCLEHKNIIAEQCTGLKDKNGKLIYEGDWLKTKDGYYCYVVWFDGFWWVKSLPSEAMDLEYSEFYKECEVIGNIHENTDLLEVEND